MSELTSHLLVSALREIAKSVFLIPIKSQLNFESVNNTARVLFLFFNCIGNHQLLTQHSEWQIREESPVVLAESQRSCPHGTRNHRASAEGWRQCTQVTASWRLGALGLSQNAWFFVRSMCSNKSSLVNSIVKLETILERKWQYQAEWSASEHLLGTQ